MKTIVILGASHAEVPLLRSARRLGLRTVLVSGDSAGLAIPEADSFVLCDYSDVEAVVAVAREVKPVAVIAGCNDFAAITASEVAVRFGLLGHDSPETTRTVHLKSEFRQMCDALKLSNPHAAAFNDRDAAMSYARTMSMPLIVKPVDLTGGKGIGVIRQIGDAEQMIDQAFSKSRQKAVVIEEYLEGTLHSCCSIIRNQQVVFDFFADELMLENPFLVASAMTPSVIDTTSRRVVRNEIEAIAKHLELVDGLVHVQFIQSEGRPRMIEVCRRPPGDLYLEFVRLSTGLDIAEVIVRLSLGERPELVAQANRPVLRQCVMADRPGKVEAVRFDGVLGPRVSNRVPLRTLPTTIDHYLTEKTEIFFAEFASEGEMRSVATHVREHVSITYS